jgi:uncharacterized OB-fold protein
MSEAFRPPLSPSPDAQPFWDACARHELVLPFCAAGDGFFFYPRTACPTCGSRSVEWRPVSGRGRLHSFTIVHQTGLPGLKEAVPFVPAIVELDEGPRLASLLIGVEPDPRAIACDAAVVVDFLDLVDGSLPVFRPA